MSEGMLWSDPSGRNLPQKLRRAVRHFKNKHSSNPVRCVVNTDMLVGTDYLGKNIDGIEICQAHNIQPSDLLLCSRD